MPVGGEDRLTSPAEPTAVQTAACAGAACPACPACPPSTVLMARVKIALQAYHLTQGITKEAFQRLIQQWHFGSG